MTIKTPEQPANSFRITLKLEASEPRLDKVLMEALKAQEENETLSSISKAALKKLFLEKKVLIKGQTAKATSAINSGTTFVDILLTEKAE